MDRLFVDLETVSRAAFADLHAACPASAQDELGMTSGEVDGILVSIARKDPSILLNRAIGLGLQKPSNTDTVRRVMGAYEAARVGYYFLHLHRGDPLEATAGWPADFGLRRHRAWMKFIHDGTTLPRSTSDLTVREIDGKHADWFGRIVAPAFDMGPAAVAALAALVGRPNWRIFMAFDHDQPAGCGALFVDGGRGWCDWAATRPEFRRRGAQGAVLAARLQAAFDAGCRFVGTETGEAIDDDPQHSYHNIRRAGFAEAYLRDNYVPLSR